MPRLNAATARSCASMLLSAAILPQPEIVKSASPICWQCWMSSGSTAKAGAVESANGTTAIANQEKRITIPSHMTRRVGPRLVVLQLENQSGFIGLRRGAQVAFRPCYGAGNQALVLPVK